MIVIKNERLCTDHVNIRNPNFYTALKYPNLQRPTLLLTSFEQKLVNFHCKISPQSFLRDLKFDHFASKLTKITILKWTVQSTNFGFDSAKRSVMNCTMTFFCGFDQNDQVLREWWNAQWTILDSKVTDLPFWDQHLKKI